MGMSATQARLLDITARLHSIDLEALGIEAQKIALATQSDKIYEEYQNALSATAFMVKFNDGDSSNYVSATYDSVCNYSECRPKNYVLVNNKTGKILVDQEMADTYKKYKDDKYSFAYAMMGVEPDKDIIYGTASSQDAGNAGEEESTTANGHQETQEVTVPEETHTYTYYVGSVWGSGYIENQQTGEPDPGSSRNYTVDITKEDKVQSNDISTLYDIWFEKIYNGYKESGQEFCSDPLNESAIKGFELQEVQESVKDPDTTETKEVWVSDTPESTSAESTTNYADIFNKLAANCNREDLEFSSAQFQFYCQKWEAINEAGGCVVIENQYESGEDGAKWFKSAVESGEIIIRGYNENGRDSSWSDTSFATSTNANCLQEINDTTQEKLAEAKYKQALKEINKKDTMFDTELSKLETERSGLNNEKESMEKIIEENIERTMNIFS